MKSPDRKFSVLKSALGPLVSDSQLIVYCGPLAPSKIPSVHGTGSVVCVVSPAVELVTVELVVITSDTDVRLEIDSLSVLVSPSLSLVNENAVSVSLDVRRTEVEVAVVISSADELAAVVSVNRLVEVSEPIVSLLASVYTLWLVTIVEKLVRGTVSDELSSVVMFGSSVVVLEEVATSREDELISASCVTLEILLDKELEARLDELWVTSLVSVTEVAGADEVILWDKLGVLD